MALKAVTVRMLPGEDVKDDRDNSDGKADQAADNRGAADRLIVVPAQDCVGTAYETADCNRRSHEADRDRGTLEQHSADPGPTPVTGGARNVSNPFRVSDVAASGFVQALANLPPQLAASSRGDDP
jgi:hypothetical protein